MSDHVDVNCANCGIEFCLPAKVHAARREDHESFYCPNGHSNYYPQETAKERKIRELSARVKQLESQLEWRLQIRDEKIADLEHTARSLRSQLAWATKRRAVVDAVVAA